MAETTRLSKGKSGYGYKYTELSQINEWLEARGESYYQYTETVGDKDYIVTVKVKADGTESKPLRGAPIIDTNTLQGKMNAAQQLGSGITYARRYSLLMAYGLATEDDDAASLTEQPKQKKEPEPRLSEMQKQTLDSLAGKKGKKIDWRYVNAANYEKTKQSLEQLPDVA